MKLLVAVLSKYVIPSFFRIRRKSPTGTTTTKKTTDSNSPLLIHPSIRASRIQTHAILSLR
jgi:hypothetical protein